MERDTPAGAHRVIVLREAQSRCPMVERSRRGELRKGAAVYVVPPTSARAGVES